MESPGASELMEASVRESRIISHRDARFRRLAGLSLGAATLAATGFMREPHLGAAALSFSAACFGTLQGIFHQ